MKRLIPQIKTLLYLLIPILFLYGVIAAKQFLYPLVFAALFAYLLYPFVNYLEKKSIPRIVAILLALILTILVIGMIFFVTYLQMRNIFEDFETLKQSANRNIELLNDTIETLPGLKNHTLEEFLKERINQFFENSNSFLSKVFSTTTGTIFKLVLLPIYTFLILYYRTKFAYFILKLVRKKNKKIVINILRDISTIAARYMGGVSIVVLILCVLNSTGFLIIGAEYALLFGMVSAFFNFIPYFGTFIGGAIPMLFVLLTSTTPIEDAIKIFLLYTIIQFIENNILTPNIVGGHVRINPFFIIVGLVFGATVWGIPGMLVIIPLLAIAREICKYVDSLKPYGFLLGPKGTQRHSITLGKIQKLFNFRDKQAVHNNDGDNMPLK